MTGLQALNDFVADPNISAIISCENKRYTLDMFEPITVCRPHYAIHRNTGMSQAEVKGEWRLEQSRK